jgi:hypothetical protein
MEIEMPEFVIVRLGKDSVPAIKKLDSLHNAPGEPLMIVVSCTQVPRDVESGHYAFLYLGSDNSKGIPTKWSQGLRAFGKITSKNGGPNYGDTWKVEVEVKVVFPESINKMKFLENASEAYLGFSEAPVIGLSSYSNQTIQKIKTANVKQDINALFYAIETVHQDFRVQVEDGYPELSAFFKYIPPSSTEDPLNAEIKQSIIQESDRGELEGLDTSESSGWDEYPLDSVFVRKEQRTVNEVVKRINNERFILNPDFQRDFVWDIKKQSRLIESCLMRIPLPVLYVAEAMDGRIVVVDGLQRLYTFKRYLNDEFALSKLGDGREASPQENLFLGKRFKDLSLTFQERLEDTQLTLYILDAKAPDRVKLDIFERVNSGEPLSRQQMRNCLFSGPGAIWLRKAAENKAFLNATDGRLNKKSMRDREVINRFCAFHLLGADQYKGDMDDFLARALEMMNGKSEQELDGLTQDFVRTMKTNILLFGKHAFRKSLADNKKNTGRTVINVALFDVCSALLTHLDESLVNKHADRLRNMIGGLISENAEFFQAITYSTNGLKQVKTRFKLMETVISEAILQC